MFRSLFHNCGKVYLKILPTMVTFSGISGLLTGIGTYNCDIHNINNKKTTANVYTYMIAYISIGIVTGVMYPISFPLCAYYVCKEKYVSNKEE